MAHILDTLRDTLRLGAVLLGMLVAGCMGLAGGGLSLQYEGKESGSHSDTASCDADGTLTGSGNVGEGSVRVTVSDGSGNELYSQSHKGDFTLATQKLTGASGSWKVTAERSAGDGGLLEGGSFSGRYNFRLAC